MHGVPSSLVNSSSVFSPFVPLMEGSPSKKDSLVSDGVVLVRRRAERGFCRLSREPALDIELNPVVTRFTIDGLPPPMCSIYPSLAIFLCFDYFLLFHRTPALARSRVFRPGAIALEYQFSTPSESSFASRVLSSRFARLRLRLSTSYSTSTYRHRTLRPCAYPASPLLSSPLLLPFAYARRTRSVRPRTSLTLPG